MSDVSTTVHVVDVATGGTADVVVAPTVTFAALKDAIGRAVGKPVDSIVHKGHQLQPRDMDWFLGQPDPAVTVAGVADMSAGAVHFFSGKNKFGKQVTVLVPGQPLPSARKFAEMVGEAMGLPAETLPRLFVQNKEIDLDKITTEALLSSLEDVRIFEPKVTGGRRRRLRQRSSSRARGGKSPRRHGGRSTSRKVGPRRQRRRIGSRGRRLANVGH
jgi:hypothetical protein